LDRSLLADLDEVLLRICKEDEISCLSFLQVVNRIIDHIFLGVPLGSGFGTKFLDSDVHFLQSAVISKSFEHSWQAYDFIKRKMLLKLTRKADAIKYVKRVALKLNTVMERFFAMIESEHVLAINRREILSFDVNKLNNLAVLSFPHFPEVTVLSATISSPRLSSLEDRPLSYPFSPSLTAFPRQLESWVWSLLVIPLLLLMLQ
jgi:hypothetical protein